MNVTALFQRHLDNLTDTEEKHRNNYKPHVHIKKFDAYFVVFKLSELEFLKVEENEAIEEEQIIRGVYRKNVRRRLAKLNGFFWCVCVCVTLVFDRLSSNFGGLKLTTVSKFQVIKFWTLFNYSRRVYQGQV